MKVDDRFFLSLLQITLHILAVSSVKSFNKSLICGGEDNKHEDPSLGHFNTSSGEFHCFFQSPNITGIFPSPDAPSRDINVSAVREHCAHYSAGLPVIPDPDMFWDVMDMVTKRERLREQQAHQVIVIMGIKNATYVETERVMYVTWDNGRTNVYNLSDETHGQKPPNPWEQKTSCCGWYVMKGAKFDTPVMLHVAGGEFKTSAYADASLFVLCHQNVTQLLAEGDGDNEIGSSTTEPSVPSASKTKGVSELSSTSTLAVTESSTAASGCGSTSSIVALCTCVVMMMMIVEPEMNPDMP